ncbi:MAG: NAD-dependent epimerase/dehydratase family protein, partial [Gammaproteobacteria bacterium]|nr:NAD-dependent epimerase/dehydratase family protein [Gammaproteobacteria bacterium]
DSRILVTGGTGFMGKWLLEFIRLLNLNFGFNCNVTSLSRNPESLLKDAPHLFNYEKFEFIDSDVRDYENIPSGVNYIIHAAASPDNRMHVTNPVEISDIIGSGAKNIFENSMDLPALKKIINISSGQVYGKISSAKEVAEADMGILKCDNITSIYPEAKRFSESLSHGYRSQYKLPIVTVRPFSFMGPYQVLDKPWAINNFFNDAMLGSDIRIISDGNAVRSYMYPSDMAFWMLSLLVNANPGEHFNLGSPEMINFKDLAEKVIIASGSNVKTVVTNHHEDNSVFVPDISKIQKVMKLDITVNLESLLKRTIAWYRLSV